MTNREWAAFWIGIAFQVGAGLIANYHQWWLILVLIALFVWWSLDSKAYWRKHKIVDR